MSNSSSNLSRIIGAAKLAALVGIIAWIVMTFPKKDWDTLVAQDKNWWLLGTAFTVALSAHVISYWRWQLLVRALDVPLSLMDSIRLGFLGTLLNLVSVGAVGGDLFKAFAAARQAESKRAEVITSVLVDRAIGLLGLVIVAGTSLVLANELSPQFRMIRVGAITLSLIGLGGLATIVILGSRLPIHWIAKLPFVGHVLYRVTKACIIFQGRPLLVMTLVSSSVTVHAMFTVCCYLISRSLYNEPPTLAQHFQAIPTAMAAATLPLTPGGVGVQEMAMDRLFKEIPNLPDQFSGLILAGMFRAILVGIALIGAVYYLCGFTPTMQDVAAVDVDDDLKNNSASTISPHEVSESESAPTQAI